MMYSVHTDVVIRTYIYGQWLFMIPFSKSDVFFFLNFFSSLFKPAGCFLPSPLLHRDTVKWFAHFTEKATPR